MEYIGFAWAGDLQKPSLKSTCEALQSLPLGELDYMSDWIHHWSRQWEYPYIKNAIDKYAARLEVAKSSLRALDSGCGVTPIPFWLSAEGVEVTGVDLDEACAEKWSQELNVTCRLDPALTRFELGDMEKLRFSDEEFDIAYSVSAIEHADRPEKCVSELCRVCRSGGLVALTFDVCEDGDHGLNARQFEKVQDILSEYCDPLFQYKNYPISQVITWKNYYRTHAGIIKRVLRGAIEEAKFIDRMDFSIFSFVGLRRK